MIRKRAIGSSRSKKESHRFLLADSPTSSYQEYDFSVPGSIDSTPDSKNDNFQLRFFESDDSPHSMRKQKQGIRSGESTASSSSSLSSKGLKKIFGNKKSSIDNNFSSDNYTSASSNLSMKNRERLDNSDNNPYLISMNNSLNKKTSEETVNKSSSIDDMKSSSCEKATSESSENGSEFRGRGRVARIAQIFSSRATVNGKKEKNAHQRYASPLTEKRSVNGKGITPPKTLKKNINLQNVTTTNMQKKQSIQMANYKQSEINHPNFTSTKSNAPSAPYTGWPGTQHDLGQNVLVKDDDETLTFATFEDEDQNRAANEEMKQWVGGDEDNYDLMISDAESTVHNAEGSKVEKNAADYHLAAAIAEALKSASHQPISQNIEKQSDVQSTTFSQSYQPLSEAIKSAKIDAFEDRNTFSSTKTSLETPSRSIRSSNQSDRKGAVGTLSIKDLFNSPDRSEEGPVDPWDIDSSILSSSAPMSSSPTTMSQTSSAYMNASNKNSSNDESLIDLSASKNRMLMHRKDAHRASQHCKVLTNNHTLSAQNLAAQNQMTPQPKPINGVHIRGYRPFIDKAMDVPNLMDYEESTVAFSEYTATVKEQAIGRKKSIESDVFDGLSTCTPGTLSRQQDNVKSSESDIFDGLDYSEDNVNIVSPEKGLRAVPAHDFVDVSVLKKSNIMPSKISNNAHVISPHRTHSSGRNNMKNQSPRTFTKKNHNKSLHFATETETSSIGSNNDDSSVNDENDLSIYYVQPILIRKLVRAFRKYCRHSKKISSIDKEDSKKAFALFEMRSRVMETDIERGLSRQGGTVAVDDLILTSANRTSMRIRDALIVSKAWRDGASPRDAFTAALLTRRSTHCYKIRRAVYKRINNDRSFSSNASVYSNATDHSQFIVHQYFEDVRWVDDIDILLLKCPSLGPRNLRGFEMFTVGDCQSLLLKLTNEQCNKLQIELADAKERQIEAEELMNEEARSGFDSGFEEDFMMTKAEMEYLNAMDEVKTISKSLAIAEKSFKSVRDRIEKLVAEYEAALVEIEDSTDVGDAYSSESGNDDNSESNDEEEQEVLSRRAQRAELRAEVAAREALLAKEEVQKVKEQKEHEIRELQVKLSELESKTSVEQERTANIITEYERQLNLDGRSVSDLDAAKSFTPKLLDRQSVLDLDAAKYAKERVKAKFRSRRAERTTPLYSIREKAPSNLNVRAFQGDLSGEEMYQRIDFYERSLQSVNQSRHESTS